MLLEAFSLSELGIFIGSVCAGLSGLLYSVSQSRCTKIKSCCCECERDVVDTPITLSTEDTPPAI